ncbi:unnamed protein product, partial [Didymodactylos carnosus]
LIEPKRPLLQEFLVKMKVIFDNEEEEEQSDDGDDDDSHDSNGCNMEDFFEISLHPELAAVQPAAALIAPQVQLNESIDILLFDKIQTSLESCSYSIEILKQLW